MGKIDKPRWKDYHDGSGSVYLKNDKTVSIGYDLATASNCGGAFEYCIHHPGLPYWGKWNFFYGSFEEFRAWAEKKVLELHLKFGKGNGASR